MTLVKHTAIIIVVTALLCLLRCRAAFALDGGTVRVNPRNGWRAFEVISTGDNPAGDGVDWAMPLSFDGIGAWLPNANTLRLNVNHETSDATMSEVNLDLANLRTAIRNVIGTGATGGISFVTSAQQAYGRWSANGGASWTATSSAATTAFSRFCSSQTFAPDTFGSGRGVVDYVHMTGEEASGGRLFALDLANRDLYQLSGVTGSASGGIGGLPFDDFENAALIDTGDTSHVAILLNADIAAPETRNPWLYVGDKGKDAAGNPSTSFLARNGLAYGSYYYLNDTLPASGTSSDGFFDTSPADALVASKFEDIDTSPTNPTQVVMGVQETGLFVLDFRLDFSGGGFNAAASGFSITKIQNQNNNIDDAFGDADNVDWSAATTLGGVDYPSGLIFVNEDTGTRNGETWMMLPNGRSLTKIADTAPTDTATTETSGILDISTLVGYKPGSVLVTNNQGTEASLSVLVNPNATLAGDINGNGIVDAADYVAWRNASGASSSSGYASWRAQFGQAIGAIGSAANRAPAAVPEHAAGVFLIWSLASVYGMRRVRCANFS